MSAVIVAMKIAFITMMRIGPPANFFAGDRWYPENAP